MAGTDPPDLLDGTFLARLEKLRILSKRLFRGRQRAERRSKTTGASLEFADYREFVPGDDLRNVDWTVYGRSDRLYLKLYEEEEDVDIHLLVDCSASMNWPTDSSRDTVTKFGWARRTAAALSYIALCNLDRVCVHGFSSQLGANAGLRRGRQQFHVVLRFLRSLEISPAPTSLAMAARETVARVRRAGLLIVLSDFLDPAGWDQPLTLLKHHGFDVHLIHILDPREIAPEAAGDLRIVDSESGEQVDVNASPAALEAYKHAIAAWTEDLDGFCARREIGIARMTTGSDFERFILKALREVRLLG